MSELNGLDNYPFITHVLCKECRLLMLYSPLWQLNSNINNSYFWRNLLMYNMIHQHLRHLIVMGVYAHTHHATPQHINNDRISQQPPCYNEVIDASREFTESETKSYRTINWTLYYYQYIELEQLCKMIKINAKMRWIFQPISRVLNGDVVSRKKKQRILDSLWSVAFVLKSRIKTLRRLQRFEKLQTAVIIPGIVQFIQVNWLFTKTSLQIAVVRRIKD